MGHIIGSGYFGSASLLTSTANVELIQQHKPANIAVFQSYKFSFSNVEACTVKINDSDDAIYLKAGQGFSTDYYDAPVYSFAIVTNAIQYNYVGAY